MTKIILPRGYLSWSALSTWERSKDKYREQYYEGKRSPESVEMRYGKLVGELLEKEPENPIIQGIPRLELPEFEFDVDIDGVRIYGKIDSMCAKSTKFLEYKTSRVGWDRAKVNAHQQLDMYALATGVTECELIWLPTEKVYKTFGSFASASPNRGACASYEVCGEMTSASPNRGACASYEVCGEMTSDSYEVRLTGEPQIFPRTITDTDLKFMREKIVRIGNEISEDYQLYLANAL